MPSHWRSPSRKVFTGTRKIHTSNTKHRKKLDAVANMELRTNDSSDAPPRPHPGLTTIKPFPLLRIPPELRLEIYSHLLANYKLCRYEYMLKGVQEPAILKVCDLIRNKALSIFVRELEEMSRGSQEHFGRILTAMEHFRQMRHWSGSGRQAQLRREGTKHRAIVAAVRRKVEELREEENEGWAG